MSPRWRAIAKTSIRRRTYVPLKNMLRADPAFWAAGLPVEHFRGPRGASSRDLAEVSRAGALGCPAQPPPVQLSSHDASTLDEVIARLGDRPLDFLMIDGDHTYEGVKQDFEMYAPLVKHDGLIAFHDVRERSQVPECEVHRFWQKTTPSHVRVLRAERCPRPGAVGRNRRSGLAG